jgi:hypothetical protein
MGSRRCRAAPSLSLMKEVLALPVDELALEILRDIGADEQQWNSANWVLTARGQYKASATNALIEAWAWLYANGLVADNLERNNALYAFVIHPSRPPGGRQGHRTGSRHSAAGDESALASGAKDPTALSHGRLRTSRVRSDEGGRGPGAQHQQVLSGLSSLGSLEATVQAFGAVVVGAEPAS